MSKNNYFEMIIEGAIFPNLSIGSKSGQTVVLKGGLIGQKVGVVGRKQKDGIIKAKFRELIEDSPLETEPGCPRVKDCGGCRYQRLTYEKELDYKLESLRKLYENLPYDKYQLFINPSPLVDGYRNKMEYTFGDEVKDGPLTLGLHKRNHFYEIVDTIGCKLVNPDFETIRQEVMFFFDSKGFKAYHKTKNEGALKFLIVRFSFSTKEIMVNLVTKEDPSIDEILLEEFVLMLQSIGLEGKIVSIVNTISNSTADAVVPERLSILYGKDYIKESLLGLNFHISPFSFFQPNPLGAESLFQKALEFAGDLEDKTVYDLYCGTGTISQIFAKKAKKVVGIEIVEEAVVKAKENAALNGLSNCQFIAGDVLEHIDSLGQAPDVLVLDPPREGIHPKSIGKIIDMGAERVVYISCNPRTQVRDLEIFLEAGYKLEKLEFFDQFPRTGGVEALTLLSRD